ncbi:MAG: ornithine cyclodeaminase [Ardenticatenales bacterium]|nr:ornithine cyclodeaminase [Ardenticatenales bacterium]
MQVRLLSADDVRRALPMVNAIEAMRGAFQALHAGQVTMPTRVSLDTPDGTMLFMPAYIAGTEGLGQKVLSVFGKNVERNLPTIHALVTLYDASSGEPRALLEGSSLTALRTGAVTGLATDLLARPDARVLTIFGAGAQAASQIEAVCAVRPIEEVYIVTRDGSAGVLAAQLQRRDSRRQYNLPASPDGAVWAADIIVTVTPSTTPLFDGSWVKPGTHVNAIGAYRPDMCEVDAALLQRALVVVDQREAALAEAGDLLIPIAARQWSMDELYAELGALVAGAVPCPEDPQRITLFKSCGLAIQDIAAAQAILQVAERDNLGQIVNL